MLQNTGFSAIIYSGLGGEHSMNFSERCKAARKKCAMSQQKFAEALGVAFATVNRWERGHYRPDRESYRLFEEFCRKNNVTEEAFGK